MLDSPTNNFCSLNHLGKRGGLLANITWVPNEPYQNGFRKQKINLDLITLEKRIWRLVCAKKARSIVREPCMPRLFFATPEGCTIVLLGLIARGHLAGTTYKTAECGFSVFDAVFRAIPTLRRGVGALYVFTLSLKPHDYSKAHSTMETLFSQHRKRHIHMSFVHG